MGMTRARRSKARSGMCWSTRKVCCCMPSSLLRISRIVTRAWLLGAHGLYPFLLKLYADGGYQGPEFRASVKAVLSQVDVEIVRRSDQAKGFVVLPKRWVVERTLAWLNRCRRLSKDWENLNRKAQAFLLMASIRFMVRRLCRA